MDPNKRKFPYHSQVDSFSVKRQGFTPEYNPGQEYTAPRVFEQPDLYYGDERVGTT